ncbi:MAG: hypothetical protein LBH95_00565 [Oscillospiraceae bacterium]|nr:hypothetical protein [Oscillospiraceae bacterium]
MKHTDLISNIIEAEHQAQALAAEAKEKKLNLREDLRANAENVRRDYFAQAEQRVGAVKATENEHTDNAIREINERHRADMDAMEKLYAENRAAWIEKIYAMVFDSA